jgi:ATP-dependent protease HslVU (ClpYQ) peptidase subunit
VRGDGATGTEITERALRIAGEICIYTNTQLCCEELS